MINEMADEASTRLLFICSHEVWVKVTYDWPTALCLSLCLCRPSFHLSKLRHKHKHKHKEQTCPFFCAHAYAYVDPVFTCLHMCLSLCLSASENQALALTSPCCSAVEHLQGCQPPTSSNIENWWGRNEYDSWRHIARHLTSFEQKILVDSDRCICPVKKFILSHIIA